MPGFHGTNVPPFFDTLGWWFSSHFSTLTQVCRCCVFWSDRQGPLVVMIYWVLIPWCTLLLPRCFPWLKSILYVPGETSYRRGILILEDIFILDNWDKRVSPWHILIVHYIADWLWAIYFTNIKDILAEFKLIFITQSLIDILRISELVIQLKLTNETGTMIDCCSSYAETDWNLQE